MAAERPRESFTLANGASQTIHVTVHVTAAGGSSVRNRRLAISSGKVGLQEQRLNPKPQSGARNPLR